MTGVPESEFLRELDVEVEADIRLNAAGTPPEDESPEEWLMDPFEVQAEAADLNSLHSAIEALEGEPGPYPPADD
ncbi:hypothetical protein ABZX12_11220 [Kribbella sp. NPDC003505]|jgi:hypothetical protein|uniref:hypothetical protein n=1 Tax=unclassified Kribbella TaxID=2644121 RepID=UPI002FA17F1C